MARLTDKEVYMSDPKIIRDILDNPEMMDEILDTPDETPEVETEIPETEAVDPDQDTPEDNQDPEEEDHAAVQEGFTDEEIAVFRKHGLMDEHGKFLGKYDSAETFRSSLDHMRKIVGAKIERYAQENPDALREFLPDEIDRTYGTPPPQTQQMQPEQGYSPLPDLSQQVESWLDQTVGDPKQVLFEQFKDDLESYGLDHYPETPEEMRMLRGAEFYADFRLAQKELDAQRQQSRAIGLQALQALEQRRQAVPSHDEQMLKADIQKLSETYQFADEDEINLMIEELQQHRTPKSPHYYTFFDDRDKWGNPTYIPALRPDALVQYALATRPEMIIQAAANARLNGQVTARNEHYQQRRQQSGKPTATAVGVAGQGKSRTSASANLPTPEEWKNPSFRDQYIYNGKLSELERISDAIDALPDEQRRLYRG